jgi:hypothetical protein
MGKLILALLFLSAIATPALAGPECRCRYLGREFDHGALVCITLDGRSKLARCDMLLNNSSWTFLKDGCPSAEVTPLPTEIAAALAADHAEVH